MGKQGRTISQEAELEGEDLLWSGHGGENAHESSIDGIPAEDANLRKRKHEGSGESN